MEKPPIGESGVQERQGRIWVLDSVKNWKGIK